MITELFRTRLKAITDSPIKHVAGAMTLAALKKEVQKQSPAVFVVPVSENAGENTRINGVLQQIKQQIAVVTAVRVRNSRTGEIAEDDIEEVRGAICTALLGWMPSSGYTAVEYVSGDLLDMANGMVWWQDNYSTTSIITA